MTFKLKQNGKTLSQHGTREAAMTEAENRALTNYTVMEGNEIAYISSGLMAKAIDALGQVCRTNAQP